MIKSISFPVKFALSRALFAAFTAMFEVSSPSEILLSFIPVLSTIHSSLVSTILLKSLLDTIQLGA